MQHLIERIRERLRQSAYMNEAAISHGVVMPIVGSLGWDTADPAQVVPEFPIEGRGRIDFALFGIGRKPSVLIEVKGVGRAVEADRQLFECLPSGCTALRAHRRAGMELLPAKRAGEL